MSVLPLFLLWFWNRASGGDKTAPPTVPPWPTTSSPPPMPAFVPHPASSAPSADTGTPLADLHHAPPSTPPTAAHPSAVHHATVISPSKHPTATHATTSPQQHAASLITRAVPAPARSAASAVTHALHVPKISLHKKSKPSAPAVPLHTADVSDLQSILISRGAKLTHDGLYGPQTARAWSALAKSKNLPGSIARASAKTAHVAAQTYDTLSVPPIP